LGQVGLHAEARHLARCEFLHRHVIGGADEEVGQAERAYVGDPGEGEVDTNPIREGEQQLLLRPGHLDGQLAAEWRRGRLSQTSTAI